MANWGKTENTPKEEALAYITKETKEVAKENEVVDTLASAVLVKAQEIMEKVQEAKLTTRSLTRDGKIIEDTLKKVDQPYEHVRTDPKTSYFDAMAIKVEPAMRWNKETKQDEPMLHKDGSQIYKAQAELKHEGTILTLTAKEDVSKGAEFVAMTASKWTKENGKPKLNYVKQDEIAASDIDKEIKKVAAFIKENGFVVEKAKSSYEKNPLFDFSVEANKYFKDKTEKAINDKGDYVNDAYAKYEKTDYGERVNIYTHSDNTVVELGITSKGDKYALAINYDLNESGEARQEGEKPAKAYINKADDLDEYLDLPEVKAVVAQYKEFAPEKEAKKEKESVERD